MNPLDHFYFGGGAAHTMLHPAVAALMIITIILLLMLPRKYAAVPLLLSIIIIPYGQELMLGGVHLFVFRILILFGWLRLICSKIKSKDEILPGGFNLLDKVFLSWAIVRALAPIFLYREVGAAVNEFGFLWDAIGGYFLFRFLIRDDEDIRRIIKMLAAICFVVGVEMLREHFTGHDVFALVGGILPRLEIRNGTPRAMGPFAHALLAGTFGATSLPLIFWLWKGRKSRALATAGIIGCTLMSSLTMCSSPVLAYAAGVSAILLWPFRNHMRVFRWAIVAVCAGAQLFMKVPFWFILGHIDLVGGSNGWYRAALIDTFIRHFSDWWLIGTNANMNWYGGAMWDQCNQFISEGETGGLLTLTLFIAMICICFRWLGQARKSNQPDEEKAWFFWLLGVALFTHVVGFFGIDYFDQSRFVWYALLAIVSTATLFARDVKAKVPAQQAILSPAWQPTTNARWTGKSGLPVRPFRIGHARAESSSAVFPGKPRRAQ